MGGAWGGRGGAPLPCACRPAPACWQRLLLPAGPPPRSASAGPFCKSNFTVSFYVPFDFQVILRSSGASRPPRDPARAPLASLPALAWALAAATCTLPAAQPQEDPPEPSDPKVEVRQSPAFVAYVGQARAGCGGWGRRARLFCAGHAAAGPRVPAPRWLRLHGPCHALYHPRISTCTSTTHNTYHASRAVRRPGHG